jgi:tRNA-splicing ligase RtcB (3'-phosphate/5'-hydroxy nucleic acid ligase)
MELRRLSEVMWELPATGNMTVPGIVFASSTLMEVIEQEQTLDQVRNVAHLPGIRRASYAMPDIHWGYGFPIGGVAATAVDDGGRRVARRGGFRHLLRHPSPRLRT